MMPADLRDLRPQVAQPHRQPAGFLRADAARAHHAMPALGLAPQIDHRRTEPARIIGVATGLRPFRDEIDRPEAGEHAEQQPDRAGVPGPRAPALTLAIEIADRQRREQRDAEDFEDCRRIIAHADGLAEDRHDQKTRDRRTLPAQPGWHLPLQSDSVHPFGRRAHRAEYAAPETTSYQHRQEYQ